jgi:hypothetical protein
VEEFTSFCAIDSRKLVGRSYKKREIRVTEGGEAQTLSFTSWRITRFASTCLLVLSTGEGVSLALGCIGFRRHESNSWQYWGRMRELKKVDSFLFR